MGLAQDPQLYWEHCLLFFYFCIFLFFFSARIMEQDEPAFSMGRLTQGK